MRYTSEQKAEALKISAQTLYKWRNEAKAPQQPEMADANPDTAKEQKVLDAQELLESDRLLQEKIAHLEVENANLRARLLKYRAALAAVLVQRIT